MTFETVETWIANYLEAWRTYDPHQIRGLFTPDATYAYNPWDEPIQGAASIAESWLSDRDEPGTWNAHYRPVIVADEKAIVVGETTYAEGKTYSNLFQISFDDRGRCSSFTEWYMPQNRSD